MSPPLFDHEYIKGIIIFPYNGILNPCLRYKLFIWLNIFSYKLFKKNHHFKFT